MQTPDITPVQWVALVGSTIDLLVQFGVDLNSGQQTSLLAFMAVLGSIVLADAHVRGKRADNAIGIRRVRAAEAAERNAE